MAESNRLSLGMARPVIGIVSEPGCPGATEPDPRTTAAAAPVSHSRRVDRVLVMAGVRK